MTSPGPPPHVLDLFAVPDDVRPIPGGQGRSVHAGDLVLSPDRDAVVAQWLSPVLARLAVRLDERPSRGHRDLRIAMPVPARDGSWVVEGWGASRHEPASTACADLPVLVATGRLLHAELATIVTAEPAVLVGREHRWAVAERLAFGDVADLVEAAAGRPVERLLLRLAAELQPFPLGPDQLVHADLAGNVLLDAAGAPVVIDVAPSWRPARWAEAICVLDAVLRLGAEPASPGSMAAWASGTERAAMVRAMLFRILSDSPCDVAAYERAFEQLG